MLTFLCCTSLRFSFNPVFLFLVYLPNSPIRNLSTIKVGWNSVTLGWMPPFNYTEPTVIYQIKCTTQNYKRILETSLTEIKLDNLIEDRQYGIEVKVGAKDIGYYKDAMKVAFNTLGKYSFIYLFTYLHDVMMRHLLHVTNKHYLIIDIPGHRDASFAIAISKWLLY